jgi:hypothetical protein
MACSKLQLNLVTLLLTVVSSAVLGCGSSGDDSGRRSERVVEVAGRVITKEALEHWIHIAAIRDYELFPTKPVPPWVIPDPPRFVRCIAHLASKPDLTRYQSPVEQHTEFMGQCERTYQQLRIQVLGALISGEWLIGEGEARGLKLTAAEERHWSEKVLKGQLGSLASAQKYLKIIGETDADQLFRAKIKLYSIKMEAELAPNGVSKTQRAIALGHFFSKLPARWAAKTSCASGYVVQNCRQYSGALPPEIKIL